MLENEQPAQRVKTQRLYIKEISCKIPHAPNFFINREFAKGEWKPEFSLEVHAKHQALPENQHEVVLHATAMARTKENMTAFILDIQQAGIFKLEGFNAEQLEQVLKSHCPTLLYPYLCRAISDASVHAGFPPIMLSPLGFEQPKATETTTNSQ